MPMAAANQVGQPQAAVIGVSVSATANGDDDPTVTLTKQFATATLETAAAAVTYKAAPVPPLVRAIPDTRAPAAKTAGARARRRPLLIWLPTDYLRAGKESRDRSRRRELARRCVGKLFAIHEDRASERGISAMMARLTTTLDSASGAAVSAAAAPSPEHAGLAELLQKMALSKKH